VGGECEVGDVGATIDGTVGTELAIRTDNGDMGCAEKPEIFEPLELTGLSISRGNAHGLIELQPAFTTPFPVHAMVSRRPGEVRLGAVAPQVFK
jgi:hypothetical protein